MIMENQLREDILNALMYHEGDYHDALDMLEDSDHLDTA